MADPQNCFFKYFQFYLRQSYRLPGRAWSRFLGSFFACGPGDFRVLFQLHQQATSIPRPRKRGSAAAMCICNILHQLLETRHHERRNPFHSFTSTRTPTFPPILDIGAHCALRSNPALFLFRRGKTRLRRCFNRLWSSFPPASVSAAFLHSNHARAGLLAQLHNRLCSNF